MAVQNSVGQVIGSLDTAAAGLLNDCQLDYYGKRVAVASADHAVHVFDITDEQQKPAGQLKGHEGPIWKVSWAHPKFGSLLATCGYDMKIFVWKEVHPYSMNWQMAYSDSSHTASVNDVQFGPWEHGLRLACASSDSTVSVLTYTPMDCQWRRASFPAHPGGAQALSWMPGGKDMRLATGGCDNSVCIWKCSPDGEAWMQESPPLPPVHTDWVRAVAWRPEGPNGSVIASGSWDKTVVIWAQEMEGQPWRQTCRLNVAGKVEGLAWSVTGSILAVSYGDGEASLYKESEPLKYEEVGKVAQSGFTEVPHSFTSPSAAGFAPQTSGVDLSAFGAEQPPSIPPQQTQQVQDQQAVLDAFGM